MLQADTSILDLSAASAMKIYMRKPDDSLVTLTATHYTDGTDGIMEATVDSDNKFEEGVYLLEPVATFAAGEWGGSPIRVQVIPSIRPSV
jgi:hypothetical protein